MDPEHKPSFQVPKLPGVTPERALAAGAVIAAAGIGALAVRSTVRGMRRWKEAAGDQGLFRHATHVAMRFLGRQLLHRNYDTDAPVSLLVQPDSDENGDQPHLINVQIGQPEDWSISMENDSAVATDIERGNDAVATDSATLSVAIFRSFAPSNSQKSEDHAAIQAVTAYEEAIAAETEPEIMSIEDTQTWLNDVMQAAHTAVIKRNALYEEAHPDAGPLITGMASASIARVAIAENRMPVLVIARVGNSGYISIKPGEDSLRTSKTELINTDEPSPNGNNIGNTMRANMDTNYVYAEIAPGDEIVIGQATMHIGHHPADKRMPLNSTVLEDTDPRVRFTFNTPLEIVPAA